MTTIYRGSDDNLDGLYWTTDRAHAENFGEVREQDVDLSDYDAADCKDLSTCSILADNADDFREEHGLDEDDDIIEEAQAIMDRGGYDSDDLALWIAARSSKAGVAFSNYEGTGIVVLMKD